MKNLLFTAFTVVFFSSASMANTFESKEEIGSAETDKIELITMLMYDDIDCYGRAMNLMDKMIDLSPVEAHDIWQVLTANC